MTLPCWLSHKWSLWSEPYPVKIIPTDEVGYALGPGYLVNRQSRKCLKCGKVQNRKVNS